MGENFAAFEYKTQEEVLTVIKFLTTVLSTTGLHILEVLSPSHLLSELHTSPLTAQSIETEITVVCVFVCFPIIVLMCVAHADNERDR